MNRERGLSYYTIGYRNKKEIERELSSKQMV